MIARVSAQRTLHNNNNNLRKQTLMVLNIVT